LKLSKTFQNPVFILVAILLGSFLIKNPFITQSFLGHFGAYQSVVGMIAFEYAQQNFSNFFYPNSLTLTNGLPSLEMIYHPFASFVAALFWKLFGGNLDYWGRFQAMLFSALATVMIYLCARRIIPERKDFALLSAFFFAFSPMSLIYGMMFMNEALALFVILGSFYFLLTWRGEGGWINLFLSGILFSVVLVLRLHYLVLFPAFLWILLTAKKEGIYFNLFSFGIVSASAKINHNRR